MARLPGFEHCFPDNWHPSIPEKLLPPYLEAGMDDFIAKPFEPEQLFAIVLKLLQRPAQG